MDDAHSLTREYDPERRQRGALYSFQAMQLYAGRLRQRGTGRFRAPCWTRSSRWPRRKSQAWSSDPFTWTIRRCNRSSAIPTPRGRPRAPGLHKVLDEAWRDVDADRFAVPWTIAWRSGRRQTYAIHASRDMAHQVFPRGGLDRDLQQPSVRAATCATSTASHSSCRGGRTHFETVGHYRLGGEPNLRWI